jgi:hypothetical protein
MGKSHRKPARKRRSTGAPPRPVKRDEAPAPARGKTATRGSRIDERPKPPWHPFPLIELCVLVGIVLIILGFIRGATDDGTLLLLFGLVLASLAGLDTAVREHFAGFRSHSMLLAGIPAVLAAGGLFFARAPWIAIVVAAPVVFFAALYGFRAAFRRASGGLSFKA